MERCSQATLATSQPFSCQTQTGCPVLRCCLRTSRSRGAARGVSRCVQGFLRGAGLILTRAERITQDGGGECKESRIQLMMQVKIRHYSFFLSC
jgi:hypothetical protein